MSTTTRPLSTRAKRILKRAERLERQRREKVRSEVNDLLDQMEWLEQYTSHMIQEQNAEMRHRERMVPDEERVLFG